MLHGNFSPRGGTCGALSGWPSSLSSSARGIDMYDLCCPYRVHIGSMGALRCIHLSAKSVVDVQLPATECMSCQTSTAGQLLQRWLSSSCSNSASMKAGLMTATQMPLSEPTDRHMMLIVALPKFPYRAEGCDPGEVLLPKGSCAICRHSPCSLLVPSDKFGHQHAM